MKQTCQTETCSKKTNNPICKKILTTIVRETVNIQFKGITKGLRGIRKCKKRNQKAALTDHEQIENTLLNHNVNKT